MSRPDGARRSLWLISFGYSTAESQRDSGLQPSDHSWVSMVVKVHAHCAVATVSPPRSIGAQRGRWSCGSISPRLASRRRTPAGFPSNSRGWRAGRATPPDIRRTALEPRRGSPGTTSSNRSRDGTTPPGWWALRSPIPGVRSFLAHPRLFRDNPSGVGLEDTCTIFRND